MGLGRKGNGGGEALKRGPSVCTSRSAKASSPISSHFYSQRIAGHRGVHTVTLCTS